MPRKGKDTLGRTTPAKADIATANRQLTRTLAALEYEQGRMREEMTAAEFPETWIKWSIAAAEAGPATVEKEILEAVPTAKGRAAIKRCIANIHRLATKAEKLSKKLKRQPARASLNGLPKTKSYNGKTYHLYTTYELKEEEGAKIDAVRCRKAGYNARLESDDEGFYLYLHKGRRKKLPKLLQTKIEKRKAGGLSGQDEKPNHSAPRFQYWNGRKYERNNGYGPKKKPGALREAEAWRRGGYFARVKKDPTSGNWWVYIAEPDEKF